MDVLDIGHILQSCQRSGVPYGSGDCVGYSRPFIDSVKTETSSISSWMDHESPESDLQRVDRLFDWLESCLASSE